MRAFGRLSRGRRFAFSSPTEKIINEINLSLEFTNVSGADLWLRDLFWALRSKNMATALDIKTTASGVKRYDFMRRNLRMNVQARAFTQFSPSAIQKFHDILLTHSLRARRLSMLPSQSSLAYDSTVSYEGLSVSPSATDDDVDESRDAKTRPASQTKKTPSRSVPDMRALTHQPVRDGARTCSGAGVHSSSSLSVGAPKGRKKLKAKDLTQAQKTGRLRKKGNTWWSRAWRDRFVILQGSDLYWFRSKRDKRPANSLSLLEPGLKMRLLGADLEIKSKKKTYTFQAATAEYMQKWYSELIAAQAKYRADSDKDSTSVPPVPTPPVASDTEERPSVVSVMEQRIQMLSDGAKFIKYNAVGRGQRRHIWFPNNLNRVLWGVTADKPRGFIMAHDITGVRMGGPKNKALTIMSSERKLHLAGESVEQTRAWHDAIVWLLKARAEDLKKGQSILREQRLSEE